MLSFIVGMLSVLLAVGASYELGRMDGEKKRLTELFRGEDDLKRFIEYKIFAGDEAEAMRQLICTLRDECGIVAYWDGTTWTIRGSHEG